MLGVSCSSTWIGHYSVRVKVRGKGVTLNKLVGKKAKTGVERTSHDGAKDGPNAQMKVTWRRQEPPLIGATRRASSRSVLPSPGAAPMASPSA